MDQQVCSLFPLTEQLFLVVYHWFNFIPSIFNLLFYYCYNILIKEKNKHSQDSSPPVLCFLSTQQIISGVNDLSSYTVAIISNDVPEESAVCLRKKIISKSLLDLWPLNLNLYLRFGKNENQQRTKPTIFEYDWWATLL